MRSILVVGLAMFALSSTSRAEEAKKWPWAKPPGPIAGTWGVTCDGEKGMVLEFVLQGDKKASGRVATLGDAGKYGYKDGEEIFKLEADDYGDWVGQLKWRSVSGMERWDPIRFVATADALNATISTDACYKNMTHAK